MKSKSFIVFLIMLFIGFDIMANENQPSKEEVTKLYVATFKRAPDSAGLDYWVKNSGLKLSQIAKSFFDQNETKEQYPEDVTNSSFINSIYNNLFNRESDIEGLEYWVEELDSENIKREHFILAIINGAKDDDDIILENKKIVGLKFANGKLEELEQSKQVMQDINSTYDSVLKSYTMIGDFMNENIIITKEKISEITIDRFEDTRFLNYFDKKIITNNEELSETISLLEEISNEMYPDEYKDTEDLLLWSKELRETNIDFEKDNVLIYTFLEPWICSYAENRVLRDNKQLDITFIITSVACGSAMTGYYLAYKVSKDIEKVGIKAFNHEPIIIDMKSKNLE